MNKMKIILGLILIQAAIQTGNFESKLGKGLVKLFTKKDYQGEVLELPE